MTRHQLQVFIAASVAVVVAGVLVARRAAQASPLLGPPTRFAPLGFSWNAQVGAYTRVNERGQTEYLA